MVGALSSIQNQCRLPGSSTGHFKALVCVRVEGARSASWPQGVAQPHRGPPCEEPIWICKLPVQQRPWGSPFPAVQTVSELILASCGLHRSLCWQWKEPAEPGFPMLGISRYDNPYVAVPVFLSNLFRGTEVLFWTSQMPMSSASLLLPLGLTSGHAEWPGTGFSCFGDPTKVS